MGNSSLNSGLSALGRSQAKTVKEEPRRQSTKMIAVSFRMICFIVSILQLFYP